MAVDFAISFRTAIDLRNILISMEQAKVELSKIQKRMDLLLLVQVRQLIMVKNLFPRDSVKRSTMKNIYP